MRASAILAFLTVATVTDTASQVPVTLQPGDRLRVTAPELGIERVVGTFEAIRGDSVFLRNPGWGVPLGSVARLEVSWGQTSQARRGALVGAVLGAAVGAFIGRDPHCELAEYDPEPVACPVWHGLMGGALGGAVGWLLGARTKTDRWQQVPLDRLRVTVTPQRHGRLALGLSVSF